MVQKIEMLGKAPKWIIIFPLILVVFSAVMLVTFLHNKNSDDKFMETAVSVNAECTEIHVTSSTDEDGTEYYYHADVQYEYEGITYRAYGFSVSESTLKGDKIEIYIDPARPFDARVPSSTVDVVLTEVLCIAGIVIGLLCLLGAFKMSRKPKVRVNDPWEIK